MSSSGHDGLYELFELPDSEPEVVSYPLWVAVSGYFDPPHEGHLEYFSLAKQYARQIAASERGNPDLGRVVVILNNESQSRLKYPTRGPVMPLKTRIALLEGMRSIDRVFVSVDDDKSVCKSLERLRPSIFAKGGDRFSTEIPEAEVCRRLGIRMVDGLGDKIQSSSELVKAIPRLDDYRNKKSGVVGL